MNNEQKLTCKVSFMHSQKIWLELLDYLVHDLYFDLNKFVTFISMYAVMGTTLSYYANRYHNILLRHSNVWTWIACHILFVNFIKRSFEINLNASLLNSSTWRGTRNPHHFSNPLHMSNICSINCVHTHNESHRYGEEAYTDAIIKLIGTSSLYVQSPHRTHPTFTLKSWLRAS